MQWASKIGSKIGANYMNIQIPFSSWMTDFFECRDHEKLLKEMFVHFKIPVENSQMDKSGFTLD